MTRSRALQKLARALGMFRDHVVLDGKLPGVVPSVYNYPTAHALRRIRLRRRLTISPFKKLL
jgi:hypothetical protein